MTPDCNTTSEPSDTREKKKEKKKSKRKPLFEEKSPVTLVSLDRDIGGQSKLRPLYRHYYVNMDALIFVIDSADQERLEEARDVMLDFLGDPDTRDCHTVLIFLNKQVSCVV